MKASRLLHVLAAFGLLLLIGVLYSQNKNAAWFVLEKKIFFFIVPVALATSAINSADLSKFLTRLLCMSCGIAILICFTHAFIQWLSFQEGKIGTSTINYLSSSEMWNTNTPKFWLFFSYVSLSGAIGIHPTYLALYCAFCCVAMLMEYRSTGNKIYKVVTIAGMTLFAVAIIFLASRIILVLFGVMCFALLMYEAFVSKTRLKNMLMIAGILVLFVIGVMANPVTKYRQVEEMIATGITVSSNTHYTNSTAIRTSLWWLSAKAYLNSNLIVGVGPGDVNESIRAMSDRYNVTNILNTNDPHSQYLYFLLSSGIIGAALFLGYIGIGFVKAWQTRDILFLAFLVLFSSVCITETALELQKGIIFFSIFFSSMAFSTKDESIISPTASFANASV